MTEIVDLVNGSSIKLVVATSKSLSNLSDEELDQLILTTQQNIETIKIAKDIFKNVGKYLDFTEKINFAHVKSERDRSFLIDNQIIESDIYDLLNTVINQKQITSSSGKKITCRKIRLGKKMITIASNSGKITLEEDFLLDVCSKRTIPLEWYQHNSDFFPKIVNILY